ncbi:MAG: hypothetical protein A2086_06690 [Spirochaetes bacterium GWD1_27_9]|nr:MAG: hypothetical protein A2Z98_00545 [Spirochaetes bacterium GWB1_27_13]OHD20056.1 MAG: hypothetical protein A2Y34_08100 [Spirochaetes bacterium GWC1_27_15]OHD41326.1 MAG: hypothetical protein A2086_06690 [Spirochaetes bacterium GWD1_27_9]
MKKFITLFVGAALFMGLSTNLFADTSVLIDFNKLKANGNGYDPAASLAADDAKIKDFKDHDSKNRTQHMPTLVNYDGIAGSNFTDDEKKKMKVSLAAYNWEIVLNSSASTVENKKFSKAIEWHTKFVNVLKDESGDVKEDGGYTILGMRIHFPDNPFNNWALVKPPFEIPAYEDIISDYKGNEEKDAALLKKNKGKKFENGYGVVKNIGVLKSIDMRIYGCQFKNSISILLKDENNAVTEYNMPQYLDFDGWKKITWVNPNYIDDAANRSLYIIPLYPHVLPYVKIQGFRIYRQGDQIGGDFVTYIRDVNVTYDKAVLDKEYPIDHEEAWGILQDRTEESKKRELTRIGHNQILKYLERQKMDKSAQ